MVTLAEWQPLQPFCPSTLQVMARLHPVALLAVRPEETPETAPDPSDWVCDAREAPLLRAERRMDRDLAAR